jgi:hypothetical protein
MFACPQKYHENRRAIQGYYGDAQHGFIDLPQKGLRIQFSGSDGWEHVSVSRVSKMPSYEDMCWVKDQFWDPEDTVMQLHVPASEHINRHPYCLHLWRPIYEEIPRPPSNMVG